jgi:hypothetical protein
MATKKKITLKTEQGGRSLGSRQITMERAPDRPAESWGGQELLATEGRLTEMRQYLPRFRKEPLVLNGVENPTLDLIVEEGTDYPVTTVSKSYGLVQHEEMFDGMVEALESMGFNPSGLEAFMTLTNHGERLLINLTLPGYDFDPGDGCPLVLKVNGMNSVDKTTSIETDLSWLRLICGNGMMQGIGSGYYRKAHLKGITPDAIEGYLRGALEDVPRDRSLLSKWLNIEVSRDEAMQWVDGEVARSWGDPAAARLWSILTTGMDARPIPLRREEPVEGEEPIPPVPPHARSVEVLGKVPGAFSPVRNAYHASQALAWIAREQVNMGTRLQRVKAIPLTMAALVGRP